MHHGSNPKSLRMSNFTNVQGQGSGSDLVLPGGPCYSASVIPCHLPVRVLQKHRILHLKGPWGVI